MGKGREKKRGKGEEKRLKKFYLKTVTGFSMATLVGAQKKIPIWECFFAFTVCQENIYTSRLLAIIVFHKTESIIFLTNFIIKKLQIVHFHHL